MNRAKTVILLNKLSLDIEIYPEILGHRGLMVRRRFPVAETMGSSPIGVVLFYFLEIGLWDLCEEASFLLPPANLLPPQRGDIFEHLTADYPV